MEYSHETVTMVVEPNLNLALNEQNFYCILFILNSIITIYRNYFEFQFCSQLIRIISYSKKPNMSEQRQLGRVNQEAYQEACNMLYTDYGEKPKYSGKDRQELQKIKHSNEEKQPKTNPYSGPEDKTSDAQQFMMNLKNKN
jgi:hypothetical protein